MAVNLKIGSTKRPNLYRLYENWDIKGLHFIRSICTVFESVIQLTDEDLWTGSKKHFDNSAREFQSGSDVNTAFLKGDIIKF